MKLYTNSFSTTSRPVELFMADNAIAYEPYVVNVFEGEHLNEPFASINPNKLIPVLEDDGFTLTESAAILRYLAEKIGSPAYPTDLRQRARVNEMMDWLNSTFYPNWGYGLVYPQFAPNHRRPSDEAQAVTIEWGREKSMPRLEVLDRHWIGPDKAYLCGNTITIADYFGSSLVSLGEVVHCRFDAYPNIERWLNTMKRTPNWGKVYEAFDGMKASLAATPFVSI
jgi:glutathione S-transferase